MPEKQITNDKNAKQLLLLCWTAYFIAELGRLNFSALIADITLREAFTKAETGAVATGFFFSYGIGQVINGVLADRLSARKMVFIGLVVSAGVNLGMTMSGSSQVMLVLWCINGFAQSMLWPPIFRVLSSWLPEDRRAKAYVHMASPYVVGTFFVYLFSAAMTKFFRWQIVFYVAAMAMLIMAIFWFVLLKRLDDQREEVAPRAFEGLGAPSGFAPRQPAIVAMLLLCIGFALITQGMLKEGVFTWVPTYITESFGASTSFSILLTTLIPVVNLLGFYLIRYLQNKRKSNEIKTAIVLFGISALSLLGLYFSKGNSLGVALFSFAVTTTCMMGINAFFVTFIPSYFAIYGRASTVSGMLNFMVYVGSGMAGYGIGAIAQSLGWGVLIVVLCVVAVVGMLFSITALPFWRRFSINLGIEDEKG